MSGGWSKTSAAGDLISEVDPFPFSVECKFSQGWHWGELLNKNWGELGEFWDQCVSDASGKKKLPILVFKANGSPIYCGFRTNSYLPPVSSSQHARIQTVDRYGEPVSFMRFRDDFLKIPLLDMYAMTMRGDDIYTWELFQKLRLKAQADFPLKPGDAAEMKKIDGSTQA